MAVEHTDPPGSPDDDMNQRVAKYWGAVGLKVDMKFVERSLYQQHVYDSDLAMGKWGFDRCSVVKADPGRWLATHRRRSVGARVRPCVYPEQL